ncbi:PLDc N-terminal domain-containing protein [Robertkochia flava]|uniref:PLDc N-terminal domain-containing protein n=1 Tax=Robertkochia flava TaxID=3447986 RepID=UPI001CCF4D47|nr:PLDc N-terminal domain-containing protein [Robertkochia marina]
MEHYNPVFSWGLFAWQLILLTSFFLWVYCLANVLKAPLGKSDKMRWTLVVLLLPLLGSVLYIFMGRNNKSNTP